MAAERLAMVEQSHWLDHVANSRKLATAPTPLRKGQGFATWDGFGYVLVVILGVFQGCRGLILASVALCW